MSFDDEMKKALEADGKKLRQLTGEDHGPHWIDDGKNSSTVAVEWVTSITLPIIPDADEYVANCKKGAIYIIQVPDEKSGGFTLPFLPEHGREIEEWKAKYLNAARGDKITVQLEDKGYVTLGVRRGGH